MNPEIITETAARETSPPADLVISIAIGVYTGVYVLCKVKLSNGKEENLVIAMRKDNPWKIWINDGGL